MYVIWKRDFLGYFRTPVGYVFIGVFSALAGLIFYLYNIQNLSGDLLTFLSQLTSLTMLLCPLLTMRLLCEERQKHTDQLTLTAPISLAAVVLGKFLAAASVMIITLFLCQAYSLIIVLFGTIYPGEWLVGHVGFTLQSMAFLSVDLLVTCFAKHQMTGALAAYAVNFVLWMADLVAARVPITAVSDVMNAISLYRHYESFAVGQFSFADCLFFLSFAAACLMLSVRVLDARRFSEGGSL